MSTVSLTLEKIFELAKKTLLANGCDDETASILANLIKNAERDGSLSHGLFRLPAYVSGLKSGKINGKGKPEVQKVSTSVIKVQGNNCLAPVVLNKGLPALAKAANNTEAAKDSAARIANNKAYQNAGGTGGVNGNTANYNSLSASAKAALKGSL